MAISGRRSKSAAKRRRPMHSSIAVGSTVHEGAWSLSGRTRRRARLLLSGRSGAGTSSRPKTKRVRHGVRVKNPGSRKGGKGYNKARARGAPRTKRNKR